MNNFFLNFFNRNHFGKKAQVTLFIIVGLVILAVSAVIINVNKSSVQTATDLEFNKAVMASDSDIKTIKQYFEKVAQMSSLTVLEDIAANGGIEYNLPGYDYSSMGIIPTLYQNYSNDNSSYHNISYFLVDYVFNHPESNPWNVSAYPCFRNSSPLSCSFPNNRVYKPFYGDYNFINDIRNVEAMARIAIEKKINNSIDWKYINNSYIIPNKTNIAVTVVFTKPSSGQDLSSASIVVNYDTSLVDRSSGKELSIGSYEFVIPARMYSMFFMTQYVAKKEMTDIYFNSKTAVLANNLANFKLSVHDNVNSKGDAIYELIDNDFRYYDRKNFTYSFAVRNRPPVLDYIKYKEPGDLYFFVNSGDIFTLQLNATDPDDEFFWYELKGVTAKFGTDAAFAALLKQRTTINSNGVLTLDTTGLFGEFTLDIAATDGADFDSQQVDLVINDIPQVYFSMQNGYYWNRLLEVRPDSKYNKVETNPYKSHYLADAAFTPHGVSLNTISGGTSIPNPQLKMLYIPCLDVNDPTKLVNTNVVPKDEYIRLNASVKDLYSKNNEGLTYSWYYMCIHPSITSEVWNKISDCTGTTCYAGDLNCPIGGTITFLLNVSDGISVGSANNTYDFKECLESCRPCCSDAGVVHSVEDLCKFAKPHGAGYDYMDYVVSTIPNTGNVYFYGTVPSSLMILKNTIEAAATLSPTALTQGQYALMSKLKYNETTETGIHGYARSNNGHCDISYANTADNNCVYDQINFQYLSAQYTSIANSPYGKFDDRLIASKSTGYTGITYYYVNKWTDSGSIQAYDNIVPFKSCFIRADANSVAGYPTATFNYGSYSYNYVYKPGYFYYKLSCNGVNSFCEPNNLWFGNDVVNELVPAIAVESGPSVPYLDSRCQQYFVGTTG